MRRYISEGWSPAGARKKNDAAISIAGRGKKKSGKQKDKQAQAESNQQWKLALIPEFD